MERVAFYKSNGQLDAQTAIVLAREDMDRCQQFELEKLRIEKGK
jgi:hypothetical protein